ncbi:MAG: alpha/beta hydrolase [Rhodospirillaceae bacterium]|jgi:pimeloyl-ACP methyl ester carboxylesterase|nr:alpha/beta hydrolase [Rhodospirillaceae bacterium]
MKTKLLLCPGLLNDAILWSYQSKTLIDVADVIVIDLTKSNSITDMAEKVLISAPERFSLAGLSMGGYVAFEIMKLAPERVIRLALFNTSARPDSKESQTKRLELINISKHGGFSNLPHQMLINQVHPEHAKDPRISSDVITMANSIGVDAFIRQQTAILNRSENRSVLFTIKVPTLVVGGRQDTITPPEIIHEISDNIVGSKRVIIEDSGHLTPLEQPQAVSALLHYWLQ